VSEIPPCAVESAQKDCNSGCSSRKRGTVPRPPTRSRRPVSRFGNEVRYATIRWPERVPGQSLLHPGSTTMYTGTGSLIHGSGGELPGVLCARGAPTARRRPNQMLRRLHAVP
jgi:hypothetical protein